MYILIHRIINVYVNYNWVLTITTEITTLDAAHQIIQGLIQRTKDIC